MSNVVPMRRRKPRPLQSEFAPVPVPRGYTGPVTLPGTGRMVYWTGRVAIGLRARPWRERFGEQAEHIQRLLLGDNHIPLHGPAIIRTSPSLFRRLARFFSPKGRS